LSLSKSHVVATGSATAGHAVRRASRAKTACGIENSTIGAVLAYKVAILAVFVTGLGGLDHRMPLIDMAAPAAAVGWQSRAASVERCLPGARCAVRRAVRRAPCPVRRAPCAKTACGIENSTIGAVLAYKVAILAVS